MKRYIAFSAIVLGLFVGLLLVVKAEGKKRAPEGDVKAVVAGNSEFVLDLYAKLKDDPKIRGAGGNLFFSPYSISTALAMTWAGARGETEKQMAEVLHFTLPQNRLHPAFGALENRLNAAGKKGGYELNVASALWGQRGYDFLQEFLELTRKNYGAGLRDVDFAKKTEKTRRTINAWVEKQTKDKIKELIKPGVLDSLTRLVLTNAIYFKGDWAIQFDKKDTRDAPFTVTPGQKVKVPMMYLKADFKYWADSRLQVLELPYKSDELGMVVLLPRKIDGLAELEKSLTSKNLEQWLAKLQKQEVVVYLPRFKLLSEFSMAELLGAMGMKDAFSAEADFSAMTGKKELFISAVLHKAFVKVNEEGTEAAAATGVAMRLTAVRRTPVFRADHPFVFMIKDNRSGSILFMGRVTNPGQAKLSREAEPKLPQDKNGNFILNVSNQSFAINPVDIKVYIDDKVAVDQDFDVGKMFPQHNWQIFQYSLPEGRHQLCVESRKGQAKLQKEFEVKGKHWAVLNYWFYPETHYEPMPKQFSFGLSDKPVYAGD